VNTGFYILNAKKYAVGGRPQMTPDKRAMNNLATAKRKNAFDPHLERSKKSDIQIIANQQTAAH
jgi:hypothetical protein